MPRKSVKSHSASIDSTSESKNCGSKLKKLIKRNNVDNDFETVTAKRGKNLPNFERKASRTKITSKYFTSTPCDEEKDDEELKTCDISSNLKLQLEFFDQECKTLAKALLGKKLVRILDNGERVSGVIVETEAYLGGDDKASHSYNGKQTARNKAMFMEPGTAYVYNIYGMYCCINISCRGDGAAVLLRGIDPLEGIDTMSKLRSVRRSSVVKPKDIGSGPSKLAQAFAIDKSSFDQVDLTKCDKIWLERGIDVKETNIVSSSRIGIDYAEEWTNKPLRFYVCGNPSVSVRDKKAEGAAEILNRSVVDGREKTMPNTLGTSSPILGNNFYNVSGLELAKALLGQVLVRKLEDGTLLKGIIVETEAYLGLEDGACHCYGGKKTAKTEAMFMDPGTAYVYRVYYSYFCFNISAKGEGAVVLIRALQPAGNMQVMQENRRNVAAKSKTLENRVDIPEHGLCNGPSKLCIALNITKDKFNAVDLSTARSDIWCEKGSQILDNDVIISSRIGLKSIPDEWAKKPWRFYIRGSEYVSKRDKIAECR